MSGGRHAEVDVYIEGAAPFARPILQGLRDLIHCACPEVVETIKWSRPFFLYQGRILCNVAAFKEHCSLGIWGPGTAQLLNREGLLAEGAMGSFGRIRRREDLPGDEEMVAILAEIVRLAGSEAPKPERVAKKPRPEILMPVELDQALKRVPAAEGCFRAMSPSSRREYLEWVGGAKRAETRERRVQQAVAQISEGKPLHWQYGRG